MAFFFFEMECPRRFYVKETKVQMNAKKDIKLTNHALDDVFNRSETMKPKLF